MPNTFNCSTFRPNTFAPRTFRGPVTVTTLPDVGAAQPLWFRYEDPIDGLVLAFPEWVSEATPRVGPLVPTPARGGDVTKTVMLVGGDPGTPPGSLRALPPDTNKQSEEGAEAHGGPGRRVVLGGTNSKTSSSVGGRVGNEGG